MGLTTSLKHSRSLYVVKAGKRGTLEAVPGVKLLVNLGAVLNKQNDAQRERFTPSLFTRTVAGAYKRVS